MTHVNILGERMSSTGNSQVKYSEIGTSWHGLKFVSICKQSFRKFIPFRTLAQLLFFWQNPQSKEVFLRFLKLSKFLGIVAECLHFRNPVFTIGGQIYELGPLPAITLRCECCIILYWFCLELKYELSNNI